MLAVAWPFAGSVRSPVASTVPRNWPVRVVCRPKGSAARSRSFARSFTVAGNGRVKPTSASASTLKRGADALIVACPLAAVAATVTRPKAAVV